MGWLPIPKNFGMSWTFLEPRLQFLDRQNSLCIRSEFSKKMSWKLERLDAGGLICQEIPRFFGKLSENSYGVEPSSIFQKIFGTACQKNDVQKFHGTAFFRTSDSLRIFSSSSSKLNKFSWKFSLV